MSLFLVTAGEAYGPSSVGSFSVLTYQREKYHLHQACMEYKTAPVEPEPTTTRLRVLRYRDQLMKLNSISHIIPRLTGFRRDCDKNLKVYFDFLISTFVAESSKIPESGTSGSWPPVVHG